MKRRLFPHSSLAALASLAVVAGFAPTVGGCGSLGDVDHREPLAVLQGQLTQTSTPVATPSNVRVAVVWMNFDGDGYRVTQDVRAEAVFPSSFRLELTDPPPAEAMFTEKNGGGSATEPSDPPTVGREPAPAPDDVTTKSEKVTSPFTIAYGSVVAYEDRNGNGKLDLVDEGASTYVDRILGSNADMSLIYFEGTVPAEAKDKNGRLPNRGYNIYRGITRACEPDATNESTLETKSEGIEPRGCTAPEWLPMSTAYNLPLTADPKFAQIMCRNGDRRESTGSETVPLPNPTPGPGPNGKYPSADDPRLACADGGKTYFYSECVTYSEGLCKGDVMRCTSTYWSMPTATAPAGWPCTIP